MKNVRIAFEIFEGEVKDSPIGYQKIDCHMIFDMKLGESFRRKARMVAGRHFSCVPASDHVCLAAKALPQLNVKNHVTIDLWYPIGMSFTSPSNISNEILTFFISWHIASPHHKVFPFSLSNWTACSTLLGTLMPNL